MLNTLAIALLSLVQFSTQHACDYNTCVHACWALGQECVEAWYANCLNNG
jgi:hypothetical protein